MFVRGQNVSGFRLVVDILFLLYGLGFLAVAIYLWSDCGFVSEFTTRQPSGRRSPCDSARWMTLLGLVISAYFGFSLASTLLCTKSGNDDDAVNNI